MRYTCAVWYCSLCWVLRGKNCLKWSLMTRPIGGHLPKINDNCCKKTASNISASYLLPHQRPNIYSICSTHFFSNTAFANPNSLKMGFLLQLLLILCNQKRQIILVLSHVMALARVMVSDTGSIKSILFISKSSLVNFIFV